MDKNISKQIKPYILEYLRIKFPNLKISKRGIFQCPFHKNHEVKKDEPSANIFPKGTHNVHCFDPNCGQLGNIFDICRKIDFDNNEDVEDEDIADYLISELKIKINNNTNEILDKYAGWNWDLVPCSKGTKRSNVETGWQEKNHKDPLEWEEWLNNNLNIGVKTGAMSKTTCIDFDIVPTKLKKKIYDGKASEAEIEEAHKIYDAKIAYMKENLPFLNWNTVTQETFGGIHFFYNYEPDIPKTTIDIEGIHIDVQNDGGQIVIEPSMVHNHNRVIKGDTIYQMSDEMKKWVLDNSTATKVKDEPKKEKVFSEGDEISLEGLNGNCNSKFVKMGGILRTFLTPKDVENCLSVVNQELLDDPMDKKSITAMCNQLRKFTKIDESGLYKKIVEYFDRHDEASARDLKECLEAKPAEIKEVLSLLIKEDKIYKQRSMYKMIKKADWKTAFIEESKKLPYAVPYFENYGVFRRGDMICVGGESGTGKSHIAINIIKKFADQEIKPEGGIRYISSEPGNRFANIAMGVGLKEGDFYFCNHYEPEKIELEDNAVTIIDWLLPKDFSQTGNLYQSFSRQLDKHGGICFIFSQLKEDGRFYAEQMVKWYASMACKYNYETRDGVADNKNTYFQTEKIRESKVGQQFVKINTIFNDDKTLELK